MTIIKTLIGISITSTILACCGNLKTKEGATTLNRKWSILELRAKDTVIKAPGLTIYDFLVDNNYTMTLYKADTAIKSYKGKYAFNTEKKTLITDYSIDGQVQHDEAQVIILNANELQLFDNNTKDTIVFAAYSR